MADLPPLWIMRHGETEWNRAGRLQGHDDSPLTETGEAQARESGRRLAGLLPAETLLLASPSGRAQATARLAFGGAGFQTDARLLEIDVGGWTGAHFDTLRSANPALFTAPGFGWYDSAPGGERMEGVATRIAGFLAELPARAAGRPVAIVTHGITLRVMRALVLGLNVTDETGLHFPQGAIHHIEAGRARLI